MKTLNVNIYKTSEGNFSLTNETRNTCKKSVLDYLHEIDPSTIGKSSKSLKNRRYRAGQSKGYAEYIKKHTYQVSSELAGVATIEYDGRLKESAVKLAIIRALNADDNTAYVHPESNKRKPAHEHLVYCKDFNFKPIING